MDKNFSIFLVLAVFLISFNFSCSPSKKAEEKKQRETQGFVIWGEAENR